MSRAKKKKDATEVTKSDATNVEESFSRESVETVRMDVPIVKLRWDVNTFSFRDQTELKKDAAGIKALADDVREAGGLLTELLVQQSDAEGGTFLVLDGHRRKMALESLVETRAPGWTSETLVPANVIKSGPSKLELLLRAAGANVQRREFSKTARARVATSLFDENCPKTEIMRLLGIKETQLERDLLVGRTPWMLDHVERRNIGHSAAATLLAEAEKADRVAEFRDEFELWVAHTKKMLREKNAERRRNDQKELSKEQLDPQRYLKTDRVQAWVNALKANRPFEEPEFKFKALFTTDGGTEKVQIDSLNVAINDLSAEDLAKIFQRVTDLGQQLEPVLMKKAASDPSASEQPPSRGQDRLRELGLESLVTTSEGTDGDDDQAFEDAIDENLVDVTSTVEFPDDDQRHAAAAAGADAGGDQRHLGDEQHHEGDDQDHGRTDGQLEEQE